jgi:hypothetical protein
LTCLPAHHPRYPRHTPAANQRTSEAVDCIRVMICLNHAQHYFEQPVLPAVCKPGFSTYFIQVYKRSVGAPLPKTSGHRNRTEYSYLPLPYVRPCHYQWISNADDCTQLIACVSDFCNIHTTLTDKALSASSVERSRPAQFLPPHHGAQHLQSQPACSQ